VALVAASVDVAAQDVVPGPDHHLALKHSPGEIQYFDMLLYVDCFVDHLKQWCCYFDDLPAQIRQTFSSPPMSMMSFNSRNHFR
jgi:hypothetical protein